VSLIVDTATVIPIATRGPKDVERRQTISGTRACVHCATPFHAADDDERFCCTGCEFVYNLISKNGLDRFYDLRGPAGEPVKSLVFRERDYSWLETLFKQVENSGGTPFLLLEIQGVSCIGCVWLIERLFSRLPGALACTVDSALGRISLRWTPGACDLIGFARELQAFGYLLGPPGKKPPSRRDGLVIRLGVCGAFAMNAMLFSIPRYLGMDAAFPYARLFDALACGFATLSFFSGGSYFFGRAVRGLRNGILHIDLPIALGLVAAYAGSVYAWSAGAMKFDYFDFVSTFTFLMLAGRRTQQQAIEKNRNRLLDLRDEPLTVTTDSGAVSAATLEADARFFVPTGSVVPVRSKLLVRDATVSLDWINGEAEPHPARIGQAIPAGAVNCSAAPLELEALEGWGESLLASLLGFTPRPDGRDEATERFIRGYIVVVIGLAALGFCGWFAFGHSAVAALQVAISVLVVSCPCASGVALPLADELAAGALRRRGVFIRERSLWRRLLRVRKIAFDKTGTLTLDTMSLRDPHSLALLKSEEKRALLKLVSLNLHPVCCALREPLMVAGIEPAPIGSLAETVGQGIELKTPEADWRLGRPGWAGCESEEECAFTRNGQLVTTFSFIEQVRHDAPREIADLRANGFSVHILSGDRPEKVAEMGARVRLPLDQCRGGMTPADKAEWFRANDARDTLMIGDGANDSLAFNEAFCTGTPAIDRGVLEQKSDFYFLGRGLAGVRELLSAAKKRRNTVRAVIGFAIVYNACAIGAALAGQMNPLVAAIIMPLSSIASIAIVFATRR
jgi:Cu2+-exporting ATPase